MPKGIANATVSETEPTPEMIEAGVDAVMSRYLDLENPENLRSISSSVSAMI